MRILVLGLAATGAALVEHLVARGDEVTVVEDAPRATPAYSARAARARELGAAVVEQVLPGDIPALVASAELVVPSPGVPERHAVIGEARRRGIPVRSEIDLAAAASPTTTPLVAITGTNGKTTVTTLTAAILEAAGRRVAVAGNIGRPLIDAVEDEVDVVVAEVSSFQLAFAETFRARAAALLNLGADHLDWHRTFHAYAQAKANVFRRQHPDDLLVFNADDPVVAGLAAAAPSRRIPFSLAPGAASGYRVVESAAGPLLVTPSGDELAGVEQLPRRSPPDLANMLAAAALAIDLGADRAAVHDTITAFDGLAHRMQAVAEHDGVRYFDDSKATNPHATLASLRGVEGVVLLAGGRNKGLDLRDLRALMPGLRGVVAIGEAAPEIVDMFAGEVSVIRATSMHDAVRAAAALARRGDRVVLSPACASFDWYESYAARGEDFAREVHGFVEVEG